MSLILDALKKSENDRKRQSNPMIADVRVGNDTPAAPKWLWWLIGLLVVNLLVLLIVVLRPARSAPDTAASVNAPLQSAPVESATAQGHAQVVREPIRAKEEVRSLSREVSVAEGPGTTPAARRRSTSAAPAPATRPAESGSPVQADEPETTEPSMPRYEELLASGSLDIPKLHIDLHFYHPEAQRRLVYINSNKYAEGETINEGPSINTIRPDGATLNYRGTDFFLPRD